MKKHDETHLYLDIDWFAIDLDMNIAHFASGGGVTPTGFEIQHCDQLLEYLEETPTLMDDIIISSQLGKYIAFKTDQEKKRYIKAFSDMARKGLYSYDKTILNALADPRYHLVTAPRKPMTMQDLPLNQWSSFKLIRFNGYFRDSNMISIDDFYQDT